VGDLGEKRYGHNAQYRTPSCCLSGADSVAIVRLRLEPKGHSDTHSHPGDELMLVLKGSVDVLLLNSGLRARLNPGDFIHFHSEDEHCALNASDQVPAELLIVRLRRSQRRSDLIAALNVRYPNRGKRQGNLRPAILAAWQDFHAAVDPSLLTQQRQQEPTQVWDRVGLGFFLQLLADDRFRREHGRLTLIELAQRGRDHQISRARFDRIHHGRSPVMVSELRVLAEIYEVAPMLLFDFVMPLVRPAIAVRCRTDTQELLTPLQNDDLRRVPSEFVETQTSEYRIPSRRLADTNVAIAWLKLPPGASSPENRHPGHELLVPFTGDIRLAAGSLAADISADRNELVHFDSSRSHSVTNAGPTDAEVFVLRIYE